MEHTDTSFGGFSCSIQLSPGISPACLWNSIAGSSQFAVRRLLHAYWSLPIQHATTLIIKGNDILRPGPQYSSGNVDGNKVIDCHGKIWPIGAGTQLCHSDSETSRSDRHDADACQTFSPYQVSLFSGFEKLGYTDSVDRTTGYHQMATKFHCSKFV